MAEHSLIEWTDATWNPITGCSLVSPGCTNCYAMQLAGTRLRHHPSRAGLTVESKAGPVWNGTVRLNEEWLMQPLQWKRPRMIFVCAHGDLFHPDVPDAWIDRVFAVMALAPQHTFQVLTKRSARMRAYLTSEATPDRIAMVCGDLMMAGHLTDARGKPSRAYERAVRHPQDADGWLDPTLWSWPLPNVWAGISAEDQTRADERVPDLLATPAAVRFVSAEPLLGPIDFTFMHDSDLGQKEPWPHDVDALTGECSDEENGTISGMYEPGRAPRLNWIIVGGESGPNARPMHPAWARSIRDQCAAAGVAFCFKQWGAWEENRAGHAILGGTVPGSSSVHDSVLFRGGTRMNRVGKRAAGRLLDGVEHNGMPEAAHV